MGTLKFSFNVTYTDDDGTVTLIPVSAECCEVSPFKAEDLTDRARFLKKLQTVEGPMTLASRAALSKGMAFIAQDPLKKKGIDASSIRFVDVYTMSCVFQAAIAGSFADSLQPKEYLRSLNFEEYSAVVANSCKSYRSATQLINQGCYSFESTPPVRLKTFSDHIAKLGEMEEADEDREVKSILEAANFDPETGKPKNPEGLVAQIQQDSQADSPRVPVTQEIVEKIDEFNKGKAPENQVNLDEMSERQCFLSTVGGKGTIYLAPDDICVKMQTHERNGAGTPAKEDPGNELYPEYADDDADAELYDRAREEFEKEKREPASGDGTRGRRGSGKGGKKRSSSQKKKKHRVWNTIAVISDHEGHVHYIRASSKKKAAIRIVAFLINNKLLRKHVVIFMDGDKELAKIMSEYLSFANFTILLDWFHLAKKVNAYVSMSIKGTIEEKRSVRKKLHDMLWVGNVIGAIAYLEGLDDSMIKNAGELAKFISYLNRKAPMIPCYLLRRMLGLPNSSNPVENANFRIVAQRQKNNGMSWSWTGSGVLANLKTLALNKDLAPWLLTGEVSYEFTFASAA